MIHWKKKIVDISTGQNSILNFLLAFLLLANYEFLFFSHWQIMSEIFCSSQIPFLNSLCSKKIMIQFSCSCQLWSSCLVLFANHESFLFLSLRNFFSFVVVKLIKSQFSWSCQIMKLLSCIVGKSQILSVLVTYEFLFFCCCQIDYESIFFGSCPFCTALGHL